MTKDRATQIKRKIDAISVIAKHIQKTMKRAPDQALALATAVFAEDKRAGKLAPAALTVLATRVEASMPAGLKSARIPGLRLGKSNAAGSDTSRSGMVGMCAPAARKGPMSRNELVALRRARKEEEQYAAHGNRQVSKQRQKQAKQRNRDMGDEDIENYEPPAAMSSVRVQELNQKKLDVWAQKAMLEATNEANLQAKLKTDKREEQRRLKTELAKQLVEQKKGKAQEKAEWDEYNDERAKNLQKFREDSMIAEMGKEAAARQYQEEYLQERANMQVKKNNDKALKRREEQRLVKRWDNEREEIARKEAQQKVSAQRKVEKLKRENGQVLQGKADAKRQQAEKDVELMKLNEQLQEQREAQREAVLTKMQADVQKKLAVSNALQHTQQDNSAAQDRRLKQEQAEHEKRERAKESELKSRKREAREKQKRDLKEQIDNKSAARSRRKQEDRDRALNLIQQEEDKVAKRDAADAKKKEDDLSVQNSWLARQLREKEDAQSKQRMLGGMSAAEAMMNMKMLKELDTQKMDTTSSRVVDKVKQRVAELEAVQKQRESDMNTRVKQDLSNPAGMASNYARRQW